MRSDSRWPRAERDTLTVLTAEKRQVKIRLHGVDAPETGRDYGTRAKQAASELAFGKQVTVRLVDTDRYGRTVAEVYLPDGKSLGRDQTRQGYTWWYRHYAPTDQELAALEAEARAAKRGLWALPGAVPPWDWRKGEGIPVTAGVVGNGLNPGTPIYQRVSAATILVDISSQEATMRPRVANTLKEFDCTASVEEFRAALVEAKAELYPGWSDEALIVTRDEAGAFCQAVKKRLNAPRLIRPFILTGLIGVRKARKRRSTAS